MLKTIIAKQFKVQLNTANWQINCKKDYARRFYIFFDIKQHIEPYRVKPWTLFVRFTVIHTVS